MGDIMRLRANTIMDHIIHISEAPQKIKIAEKTLRNWRSQGIYPQLFIKIGGKVFIDLDEFENIIQAQKDRANDQRKRLNLD
jgi:hypothetical protein